MMDLIGQTIGNHRIEATLGSGAMGEVFRGVHIHLGRRSAIKVMHPRLAADPSFQRRFEHEAQVIAALTHPHIIGVQDFGDDNNRLYLVLELADAGSLRTMLLRQPEGHPCPLPLGLELVAQAADGLAYAHEHGMVHRDIKPDNLLLRANTPSPTDAPGVYTVKISDFGLARMTDTDDAITATGVMMGTPAYMSPEQCQGNALDGRCDIYALGVVLYEVAVGFPPFQTTSLTEAVYKHVYTPPPPPRSVRADVSPELERVILRCLAKRPEERYPTAAALAADLRALIQPGASEPAHKLAYAQTVITPLQSLPTPQPLLVSLTPTPLSVAPGQAITIPATVMSQGPEAQQVTIAVEGLPHEWVSDGGQRVVLPPHASVTTNVILHAPNTKVSRAVSYAVTLRVHSIQNPSIAGSATAAIQLEPFGIEGISVSPRRAFGFRGAKYTVTVRNSSAVAADYALNVVAISPLLSYELAQPAVHSYPGQVARVRLTVRSASHWSGPATQHLSVQYRSATLARAETATARYVHVPAIAARTPKLVYLALAVIVLLGLYFVLPFRIHPAGSSGHGGTPLATATSAHAPLAWRSAPPLPTARYGLAAVVAPDGRIIAIGGNTGDPSKAFSVETDALAPESGGWIQLASMNTPRSALGAALGPFNRIYAVAGVKSGGPLTSIEAYDFATNKWSAAGNINPNVPRFRIAVVAGPDGSLYIIGGENGDNQALDRFEVSQQTNLGSNHFGTLAHLLTPRSGPAAALGHDGRIYVFGGSSGGDDSGATALDSGEVYTPGSDTWQPIAPMPTARYRAAAVTAPDGRIYVIGGLNASGDLNTVDVYDPASNTWSVGPRMSSARNGLAAVLTNGHIYAIGGRIGKTPSAAVEILE